MHTNFSVKDQCTTFFYASSVIGFNESFWFIPLSYPHPSRWTVPSIEEGHTYRATWWRHLRPCTQLIRLHGRGSCQCDPGCTGATPHPCSLISWFHGRRWRHHVALYVFSSSMVPSFKEITPPPNWGFTHSFRLEVSLQNFENLLIKQASPHQILFS